MGSKRIKSFMDVSQILTSSFRQIIPIDLQNFSVANKIYLDLHNNFKLNCFESSKAQIIYKSIKNKISYILAFSTTSIKYKYIIDSKDIRKNAPQQLIYKSIDTKICLKSVSESRISCEKIIVSSKDNIKSSNRY